MVFRLHEGPLPQVAIYFFWLMTGEAHLVEHLDNWAVLAFCLWRIHRQDDVMCYVTRKGLIVRRQFRSLHEFYDDQFHEERSLIFLPYKDIFVISDNWQEIQLGEAEEGGLAVLPVHLQFLSKRNNSASSTASSRPMKRTMTKAPIDRTVLCAICMNRHGDMPIFYTQSLYLFNKKKKKRALHNGTPR